jgi:hypothetical protein
MVLVAGVEAGSNVVENKKFQSPAVKLRGCQINGCREDDSLVGMGCKIFEAAETGECCISDPRGRAPPLFLAAVRSGPFRLSI